MGTSKHTTLLVQDNEPEDIVFHTRGVSQTCAVNREFKVSYAPNPTSKRNLRGWERPKRGVGVLQPSVVQPRPVFNDRKVKSKKHFLLRGVTIKKKRKDGGQEVGLRGRSAAAIGRRTRARKNADAGMGPAEVAAVEFRKERRKRNAAWSKLEPSVTKVTKICPVFRRILGTFKRTGQFLDLGYSLEDLVHANSTEHILNSAKLGQFMKRGMDKQTHAPRTIQVRFQGTEFPVTVRPTCRLDELFAILARRDPAFRDVFATSEGTLLALEDVVPDVLQVKTRVRGGVKKGKGKEKEPDREETRQERCPTVEAVPAACLKAIAELATSEVDQSTKLAAIAESARKALREECSAYIIEKPNEVKPRRPVIVRRFRDAKGGTAVSSPVPACSSTPIVRTDVSSAAIAARDAPRSVSVGSDTAVAHTVSYTVKAEDVVSRNVQPNSQPCSSSAQSKSDTTCAAVAAPVVPKTETTPVPESVASEPRHAPEAVVPAAAPKAAASVPVWVQQLGVEVHAENGDTAVPEGKVVVTTQMRKVRQVLDGVRPTIEAINDYLEVVAPSKKWYTELYDQGILGLLRDETCASHVDGEISYTLVPKCEIETRHPLYQFVRTVADADIVYGSFDYVTPAKTGTLESWWQWYQGCREYVRHTVMFCPCMVDSVLQQTPIHSTREAALASVNARISRILGCMAVDTSYLNAVTAGSEFVACALITQRLNGVMLARHLNCGAVWFSHDSKGRPPHFVVTDAHGFTLSGLEHLGPASRSQPHQLLIQTRQQQQRARSTEPIPSIIAGSRLATYLATRLLVWTVTTLILRSVGLQNGWAATCLKFVVPPLMSCVVLPRIGALRTFGQSWYPALRFGLMPRLTQPLERLSYALSINTGLGISLPMRYVPLLILSLSWSFIRSLRRHVGSILVAMLSRSLRDQLAKPSKRSSSRTPGSSSMSPSQIDLDSSESLLLPDSTTTKTIIRHSNRTCAPVLWKLVSLFYIAMLCVSIRLLLITYVRWSVGRIS